MFSNFLLQKLSHIYHRLTVFYRRKKFFGTENIVQNFEKYFSPNLYPPKLLGINVNYFKAQLSLIVRAFDVFWEIRKVFRSFGGKQPYWLHLHLFERPFVKNNTLIFCRTFIIYPLPKFGILSQTGNYRGISLSSVTAKVTNNLYWIGYNLYFDIRILTRQISTTAHILALLTVSIERRCSRFQ